MVHDLQHHSEQIEIVVWVNGLFKEGLCQKINILTVFTQKVPLNSKAFEFVTKIIFRHGHNIRIILKYEIIGFEPEKKEMESGARFLVFSISLYNFNLA